ncbi:trk system potassium uptake protein TrkH [Lachnotalea glycerini]|uniref:Trk system potassium uptake protein TrkH n=1 Tax=Lachnotalea glycerini TaxID=1763509 RepID=A0A318EQR8_9FIRM|nr:TrkH family potassium uptake protein [Lachnotalea glycerini]PXV91726.1 trk system potassium uptake protein TrkH [Lachnotalea glycerini]
MLEKEKIKKEHKFNTTQLVALGFFGVIMSGAVLLTLPISASPGNKTNFIDALFTAATSVCVTGLTTVSTANHWSIFGKVVILILIQLGGLGVVTCVTLFLVMANRRITLNERIIIRESYGLDTMEGMVKLIKRIVKGTLFVEAMGAILYSIQFIPEFGPLLGIWRAVFNSVSAFCNAGMDILGDSSLSEYRGNLLVNFTTMTLIIFGGIGFTVWWDVLHVTKEVLHKNIRKKLFFESLTLHSKLAISMTIYLLVTGCFIIFIFEYNNPLTMKDLSFGDKLLASMFQSVTTRTAGFFTISQEKFTNASAMISMILMFIGGSPAGTAGGMKTTTIAMIILTTISYVKSRNDTEVYKRKIASDNVRMGLVVVTLGIIVLLTSVTLMCAVEDAPFIDIIYELTSALGTVGLSRSLTPTLSTLGKIIVIVVMYIGRIGPITLVVALANRRNTMSKGIDFPEKRIMIG